MFCFFLMLFLFFFSITCNPFCHLSSVLVIGFFLIHIFNSSLRDYFHCVSNQKVKIPGQVDPFDPTNAPSNPARPA
ncbi:hypothetical protein QBC45DRAFT_89379 [Copromyces sp. CBS 386.78]|nr:hypothetical protein QBC45DRAFT_89379 [Copromyces sp. CBS 386.78]